MIKSKHGYLLATLILLLPSCVTNRIHVKYDDFEKQRKYKLEQYYYAKKDFYGSTKVKITFYKIVSDQNIMKANALLMVYSSAENGKLQEDISFRIDDVLYRTVFYDQQAKYGYNYSTDYDDDENIETNQNFSGNNNENIRNLVYFDFTDEIIDEILKSTSLRLRFYIGKEAYTVTFPKAKLKQFKKFLSL